MVNCAVLGCNNESRRKADCGENTTKVSFFSVPTVVRRQCNQTLEVSTKRRAEWFRRLNRGYINTNATHYKVCSEHFVSGECLFVVLLHIAQHKYHGLGLHRLVDASNAVAFVVSITFVGLFEVASLKIAV